MCVGLARGWFSSCLYPVQEKVQGNVIVKMTPLLPIIIVLLLLFIFCSTILLFFFLSWNLSQILQHLCYITSGSPVSIFVFNCTCIHLLWVLVNLFSTFVPPDGPAVPAAPWLVAVERAPSMPLAEGLLGLSTQLAGRQTRPEAANVEQGGVEGCQVISTWSRREGFRQKLQEEIYGHFWFIAQCEVSCRRIITAKFHITSSVGVMEIQLTSLVATDKN